MDVILVFFAPKVQNQKRITRHKILRYFKLMLIIRKIMLIIRPICLLLVHVYIYCFYRYLTYLNTNTDKPTMKKMTILRSAFVLVAMSKTGCKKYYGHFENVFGICRTKVNFYVHVSKEYIYD